MMHSSLSWPVTINFGSVRKGCNVSNLRIIRACNSQSTSSWATQRHKICIIIMSRTNHATEVNQTLCKGALIIYNR